MKNKNTYHRLPFLDGLEVLDAKNHVVDFPFHTHNTFNITLVLDQVFSTKLVDRFLQAPKGTLFITNPNEVHATVCETKIGNSFFTFYVTPDVLKELNHNAPVYFEDKVIYNAALFQQLYFLSQNLEPQKFNFEKKLQAILTQLVLKYSKPTFFSDAESQLFQQFLEADSFEKFSLENTAQQFGLDKYKFLRLFKTETGLTPNNYLILKRIEKSKALLRTQDDLLAIAIETGFYDATHFCKYFKKITGITPIAYKNG